MNKDKREDIRESLVDENCVNENVEASRSSSISTSVAQIVNETVTTDIGHNGGENDKGSRNSDTIISDDINSGCHRNESATFSGLEPMEIDSLNINASLPLAYNENILDENVNNAADCQSSLSINSATRLESTVIDEMLHGEPGISGRKFSYKKMKKVDNNIEIESAAANISMNNEGNKVDGNNLAENKIDQVQMSHINSTTQSLNSTFRTTGETNGNGNNDIDNNLPNDQHNLVSTPSTMADVVSRNTNNDNGASLGQFINVSENSYNQNHGALLPSVNSSNRNAEVQNSEVAEEQSTNANGYQSNYSPIIVRRLSSSSVLNESFRPVRIREIQEEGVEDGMEEVEQNSLGLDQLEATNIELERVMENGRGIQHEQSEIEPMVEEDSPVIDEGIRDGELIPIPGSDGVSLSSSLGLDNEDVDDNGENANVSDEFEGDFFENASGVNNDAQRPSIRSISYDIEYESLRDLIVRTRRSMDDPEPPSELSTFELAPRDTFMQRFRRILFILSSRRRRLIRLGLASPDPENPDGGGAGAILDTNFSAALQQLARSLGMNLNFDINQLEQQPINTSGSADRVQANPNSSNEEVMPLESAIRFDTSLPAEHAYMGNNMNRVCGVNYLEAGQQHNIMLFMHHALLYPGEILPLIVPASVIDGQNDFLFGICFPFLNDSISNENIYGVTCQIYEKGADERGNVLIKSRALQRFTIKSNNLIGPLEYISDHPQTKCFGNVKILADIYLREPLKCVPMGSFSRFRDINSVQETYKRYQAAALPFPLHVYEYYGVTSIIEKARSQLAQHKIETMPSDPIQLSYWLVRNLHVPENLMHSIFLTDSVNTRLELISKTFKQESIFICRYCSNHIADCRELFAMSKLGVQTQYCNSAGYVHETNTLYQVNLDAILYNGTPSTEFCWFPGYQWHVIVCRMCKHHLGWEFLAVKPNLLPKKFYGISSSGISVRAVPTMREDERLRTIMNLNSVRAMMNRAGVVIGDNSLNNYEQINPDNVPVFPQDMEDNNGNSEDFNME